MLDKDNFQSENHYKKFNELMDRAGVTFDDRSSTAMFYIVSGNKKLFEQVDEIYSFDNGIVKQDKKFILSKVNLPKKEEKMLRIALDLYNLFSSDSKEKNIYSIFKELKNDKKIQLIITAFKITFISKKEYF